MKGEQGIRWEPTGSSQYAPQAPAQMSSHDGCWKKLPRTLRTSFREQRESARRKASARATKEEDEVLELEMAEDVVEKVIKEEVMAKDEARGELPRVGELPKAENMTEKA